MSKRKKPLVRTGKVSEPASPYALRRWRERWQLANEVEVQELRAMTPDAKIRTLATLLNSARIFKRLRPGNVAAERAKLCRRWARLREVLGD